MMLRGSGLMSSQLQRLHASGRKSRFHKSGEYPSGPPRSLTGMPAIVLSSIPEPSTLALATPRRGVPRCFADGGNDPAVIGLMNAGLRNGFLSSCQAVGLSTNSGTYTYIGDRSTIAKTSKSTRTTVPLRCLTTAESTTPT